MTEFEKKNIYVVEIIYLEDSSRKIIACLMRFQCVA